MKRMKWLGLLISVMMVLTLIPAAAFAADAQTPVFTTQPASSVTGTAGEAGAELSAEASVSDSGTISYQWYKNTTDSNTGGTAIAGATDASYAPSTDTVSTSYYYAVATNTLGSSTASAASNVCTVSISGMVHILIENTTYQKSAGAAWDGVLLSSWITIDSQADAISAVRAALAASSIAYDYSASYGGYISGINGLAAGAPNAYSGWMGAINNWYTSAGLSSYTVTNGGLTNGDEIEMRFTADGSGTDLRDYGSWNDPSGTMEHNKNLKGISFSTGSLDDVFSPTVYDYGLVLPAGTSSVKVTPAAENTSYQVKTSVGTKEYKLLSDVPVEAGTVITVTCGGPNWSDTEYPFQTYTFTVQMMPYADVSGSDWFNGPAAFLYANGIMTGVNKTTFDASKTLCRAEVATILYRMAGSPAVVFDDPFTDVTADAYYANAVAWGKSVGIFKGYGNGEKFGPSDSITREQLATMMYRYASYCSYDVSETSDLAGYPDGDKITPFALNAMKWAVGTQFIRGSKGMLNPQDGANRAECATIITRFIEKYGQLD